MSATSAAIRRYEQAYAGLAGELAGPAWLAELRDRALASFVAQGFPGGREEHWKYTNLRSLEKRAFAASRRNGQEVGESDLAALAFPHEVGDRLVFLDGHFAPRLSRMQTGVTSLAERLATEPEQLAERLGRYAGDTCHRFAALNTAFVTDGAVISVPAGTELPAPVYLLFLSLPGAEPVVAHPRVLIRAERGARATIIEHYAGLDGAANFTNAVTEISVEAGASIDHYRVQEETQESFHLSTTHVTLDRDSSYSNHNVNLGGVLVRNDIEVRLEGPGAETELNGLFLAAGRQHVDNHTRIDHLVPHTRSREDYRGVLDGRGRGVFNGKVVVHEDAQHIDAHQSNNNLLLSERAEVDTKPELEIYADDVKCSHGATVGQLDADALFYLRSRGLDEAVARGLLTFAFADDVITRIALAPIRHRLETAVLGRLPEHDLIGDYL